MDKHALDLAIKACAIADVYLRSSAVRLNDEFDPTVPDQRLDVEYRIETKHREEITREGVSLLRVYVDAGLRYLPAKIDQESNVSVLAEIAAQFVAVYRISGEKPQEECLNEFSKLNAPYHIWPYWREYAQSLCMRHRLPPIMLPMLSVNHLDNNESEDL